MSRAARSFHKNMLIVCEGEVTEPEYFALLRKMALAAAVWEVIEIRPKPRSEEQEERDAIPPPPHKSLRPKRQLRPIEIPDEADEIEQRYAWRQTPVNYVKEARGGLKDDVFEEVWAVFDRNGHPAHEQAFALAAKTIEGKPVRIAFSSIAFEQWVLLHFEQNAMAFVKSECKQDGRHLGCGTDTHADDCRGNRCVSGYMRVRQYIPCSTKSRSTEFQELLANLASPAFRHRAYENAAWLRFAVSPDAARPYLTNPYSNVDELVKRLLGEESQIIEWAAAGQTKDWQSLRIQVRLTATSIEVDLQNTGTSTLLVNGADVALLLHKGPESIALVPQKKVLLPNATAITHTFFIPDGFLESDVFEIRQGDKRLLLALSPE